VQRPSFVVRSAGAFVAIAFVAVAFLVGSAAAGAATAGRVSVKAAIDGHDVSRSSNGHPIVLHPSTPATLDIDIDNGRSTSIEVRTVRLSGHVVGLTFYSYDITVDTTVDPNSSRHLTLPVALGGLKAQATGLMAGSVQLLGPGDSTISSVDLVSDVRGSATSVYGVFGIAIALIAALGVGGALLGLARGTLPANRFVRAVRFAAPFAALGLLVVFTLSAFRVLVPRAASEIPIVAVTTAIGYLIGYLSPHPEGAVAGEGTAELSDAPLPVGSVAARPTLPDPIRQRQTEGEAMVEPIGSSSEPSNATPG
jgi:hypothetical protein